MLIEQRLKELGIELPDAPNPMASYLPSVRTGNLIFISGQGTVFNGVREFIGKVGKERTKEEGYQAAYICGLNLLAQLKKMVGDLDQVKKIVHIKGYVACSDDFYEQPAVINGVSDLMVTVFGNEKCTMKKSLIFLLVISLVGYFYGKI
jgi:enamine deaminase RidA (YjgF/YER057c/UK114 family)